MQLQIAKIHEIPAIVKEFSEQEAAEIALVENIQRRDLSSIEEALAYQQLIQTFGYTQQTLSTVIGKSRSHIANLLRLLTCRMGSVRIRKRHSFCWADSLD